MTPSPHPDGVSVSGEEGREGICVDPKTGCHNWQLGVSGNGYVYLYIPGVGHRSAHRLAYEAARGPIPEGMEIDHVCRNTRCCNADHLEVVTAAENQRRRGLAIDQCVNGHDFDFANTRHSMGRRVCRACVRERRMKYYWARQAHGSEEGRS